MPANQVCLPQQRHRESWREQDENMRAELEEGCRHDQAQPEARGAACPPATSP